MKNIMRFKIVCLFILVLSLSSCRKWTKQEKDNFIENCQRSKLNDAFCDCALQKAMEKYNKFDKMTADEENMANLLYSCIEEDRIITESTQNEE